jgi:hypothetical protein
MTTTRRAWARALCLTAAIPLTACGLYGQVDGVVTRNGRPLAGASVELDWSYRKPDIHSQIGKTDAEGRFSFSSMSPHDIHWMIVEFPRDDAGACGVEDQPAFRVTFEGTKAQLERDVFPLGRGEHLTLSVPITCGFEHFESEVARYLALAGTQPPFGDAGYLTGKVLLIETERKAISPLQSQLPEAIRARTASDVGTVILITAGGGRVVGGYGPPGSQLPAPGTVAMTSSRDLVFIDAKTAVAYARETFAGGPPPATIPGGQFVGAGSGPNVSDMFRRILELPRREPGNK